MDQNIEEDSVHLGLRHLEITGMIDVLKNPLSTRIQKVKSIRFLNEVMAGRQREAYIHGVLECLTPLLSEPPNSVLMNTIITLSSIVVTEGLAKYLIDSIPRLVSLLDAEVEQPIRRETAGLLSIMATQLGPIKEWYLEPIPTLLTNSVSSRIFDVLFQAPAFILISRLANNHILRSSLIQSEDFLIVLIRSFSNPQLRNSSIILASNIAMDPTHKGKIALIQADIINSISLFLESPDVNLRYSSLSLIALLTVPKEGKHKISTDRDIPEIINRIAIFDQDEKCRQAAEEIRVLVAELPLGEAIIGASGEPVMFS